MARKPVSFDDLAADSDSFAKALAEETDRGCALVAAAYLDGLLESYLRDYFVDNPDLRDGRNVDSLVGSDRSPLGTFSARTKIAYFLGLIGPKMYHDLDSVRKIRNKFAHSRTRQDFDQDSIKDLCAQLTPQFLPDRPTFSSNRERFVAKFGALSFCLSALASWVDRCSEGKGYASIPSMKTKDSESPA